MLRWSSDGLCKAVVRFHLRERFSCGIKRAAQKQHRGRRARHSGLSTDRRTGLPCRHRGTTNQARPFRRATRAVKAHRASLTNRCKPANIASCSCAAGCWLLVPPPQPQAPIQSHGRRARAGEQRTPTPRSDAHPLLPAVRYGGDGEEERIRRGW